MNTKFNTALISLNLHSLLPKTIFHKLSVITHSIPSQENNKKHMVGKRRKKEFRKWGEINNSSKQDRLIKLFQKINIFRDMKNN